MPDRRALVTGATGGIGRAVVASLAEAGWDVALHHRRSPELADHLASDVRTAGGRAHVLQADLSAADVDATCLRLLDEAEQAVGPLAAAVLTAGSQELTPWDGLSAAAWDAMYRDSLRHTAALVRAAGERMAGRPGGGAIVVIGSTVGWRPAPDHGAYSVMKAATHHLVAAAAQELGPRGVRVLGIAPGLVDREGLAQQWPDGHARWCSVAPLGRPVSAAEVAALAAFLVTDAASGMTGCILPVDAGWSAAPGW